MPQIPGINTCNFKPTAQVVTNNGGTVTTGLGFTAAPRGRYHFKYYLPITVGATGGVRVYIAYPSLPTSYNCNYVLYNTVAPAIVTAATVSPAQVFNNPLANAGQHWMIIEGTVEFGAGGGGLVDLEIGQNTADALSLTLLQGAFLELTQY